MAKMKISWVLPIYNESGNIHALTDALSKLAEAIKKKYDAEFIFIDDGSKDDSLSTLLELQKDDSRIKIIEFSRNFGHQIAITAGLDHATGDAIIFMDSDLQDPPRICLDLIEAWENGYDVAYAKRRKRKDSFFKRATAYVFYRLLRKVSDIDIPTDTGDFRLISKQVADVLRSFPERNRFIRGLVSYIGFRQKAVLFDRAERKVGDSGYSLKKMLKLAEDAMTGFSLAPIMVVGTAGALLTLAGVVVSIVGVFYWNIIVCGLGFITALVGLILISMATIGQYTGRAYQELQRRPLYIVKEIHEKK